MLTNNKTIINSKLERKITFLTAGILLLGIVLRINKMAIGDYAILFAFFIFIVLYLPVVLNYLFKDQFNYKLQNKAYFIVHTLIIAIFFMGALFKINHLNYSSFFVFSSVVLYLIFYFFMLSRK